MTVVLRKFEDSKNIDGVGYDADSGELHVKFKSGATYIHKNVTADHHEAFVGADSVGKHYAATFRGNPDYPHRLLPGEPTRKL